MKRREFVRKGLAGVAALPLATLHAFPSPPKKISLKAKLTGHEADWTFVGSKDWIEDSQGILSSPVWTQCIARKGGNDLLKREDCAYPSSDTLADTDLSVEFRTYIGWSISSAAIVFRAQDSTRFYVVEFFDMGRKGAKYEARLFVQDASGYRRDIASGFAPHPGLPERLVQEGPRPEEWKQATPGWMKVRVQAQGETIRLFVNEKKVLEVKDSTYAGGRAGIVARGPVQFRNLTLAGTRGTLSDPWKTIAGEQPPYFYPWPDPEKQFGNNQTYPGIFRTSKGHLVVWMGVTGDPHLPENVLLVRSRDEGKTWGEPVLVKKSTDGGQPWLFFGHQDGRISCLYNYGWGLHGDAKRLQHRLAYSSDGGKTWTNPVQLVVSGKPLYEYGDHCYPYSPITRCSDGTLLQFFYSAQVAPGGSFNWASQLRDRSFVIRSTDDGKTWTGPHYLNLNNFDSCETMGAERADGSIVAFSRSLRSPFMWVNTSPDKGIAWTKQVESNCTGECPFLIRHSSGVLVMGSRGLGLYMKTSTDEGKTWSRETRISLCSGMMGMAEMKDGRVLVVFHEAYRTPTRIRGHYMRVHKDGTLSPA